MYNVNVSVEAGDYNLSKQLNLMSTTYGANLAEQLAGEFDLVAVPGIGKSLLTSTVLMLTEK